MEKRMSKPIFLHDCEQCVSLGHHNQHDLYYCDQLSVPTVLARYGNEGYEYLSGLPNAEFYPVLAEAKRRATERGLLGASLCERVSE
jgi:hypothetical protein